MRSRHEAVRFYSNVPMRQRTRVSWSLMTQTKCGTDAMLCAVKTGEFELIVLELLPAVLLG